MKPIHLPPEDLAMIETSKWMVEHSSQIIADAKKSQRLQQAKLAALKNEMDQVRSALRASSAT